MLTNFCNNWGKWWSYLPPLQQYCHVWPGDDAWGHHRLNFPPSVAAEVKWQTDANMQQWPLRDNKDQSTDKTPLPKGQPLYTAVKPYITATFAYYQSATVLELHHRPWAKCAIGLSMAKFSWLEVTGLSQLLVYCLFRWMSANFLAGRVTCYKHGWAHAQLLLASWYS